MKNVTTYTVITTTATEGVVAEVGITKKAKAVALAETLRTENAVNAFVVTPAGKIVFEIAAPRKIKMSAPYTRVVPVTEEVAERIDGARVAYKRGRKGTQFALLDDAKGAYRIWDVDRAENVEVEVSTTREAGRWFADERVAYRAANPVPVLTEA